MSARLARALARRGPTLRYAAPRFPPSHRIISAMILSWRGYRSGPDPRQCDSIGSRRERSRNHERTPVGGSAKDRYRWATRTSRRTLCAGSISRAALRPRCCCHHYEHWRTGAHDRRVSPRGFGTITIADRWTGPAHATPSDSPPATRISRRRSKAARNESRMPSGGRKVAFWETDRPTRIGQG